MHFSFLRKSFEFSQKLAEICAKKAKKRTLHFWQLVAALQAAASATSIMPMSSSAFSHWDPLAQAEIALETVMTFQALSKRILTKSKYQNMRQEYVKL